MPPIKNVQDILKEIQKNVESSVMQTYAPSFIPTGMMEPAIEAVGCAKYRIVNLQTANKCGKTCLAVQIFKNIIWEPDLDYFDYPAYKNWPFVDDNGEPIKKARIYGTPQNVSDSGPIRDEILRWWPKGRYKEIKNSKNYYSLYETDTGWLIDVMTYEQAPSELEGKLLSFQWGDEPPKPKIMGAIMSRFQKGGILFLSQTPVAAQFLDIVDDLERSGTKVKHIYGSIYQNSKTSGTLNKKGTKKGLMSDEEIEEYVNSIPLDERPARCNGEDISKQGKIFYMFDSTVHVRHFELDSDYARTWNCYLAMDPHDRKYPALQWWAVTPPNSLGKIKYICYNEWPTYETLKGYYFERTDINCKMSPKEISQVIKILDGTALFGLNIIKRGLDWRFAALTKNSYAGKQHENILEIYQPYGIYFTAPQTNKIETQRTIIRNHLGTYDPSMPITEYNDSDIYICPWCKNTRISFERHYWAENETESETYKDFIDTARIFFAMLGSDGYIRVDNNNSKTNRKKPQEVIAAQLLSLNTNIHNIALA